MATVEERVFHMYAQREAARGSVSDEFLRKMNQVREKCQAAEKQEKEGGYGLTWRRGPSGLSGLSGRGQPNRFRGHQAPRPAGTIERTERPHVARYVSQFQNSESAMEDKILNQVILNKLNKFSAANYEDIKSFLQQILDSNETEFLQSFMILVFKKAAAEEVFCPLYAKMLAELSISYKTLRDELESIYTKYLTIFEEVSEEQCKDYEMFVQRNREKQHRLGYSQFLAELTRLGVLEAKQLEALYTTVMNQLAIHSKGGEAKQKLCDEYIECLLRMTKAFKSTHSPKVTQLRMNLRTICEEQMANLYANRTSDYPGISKMAAFALLDCLDIFRA